MVGATFFGLDISQFTTRLLSLRRRISKRVLLLEFGPDSLLLAEATLTQLGVKLSHVSAFALPPEALDRGVPAEPLKMAALIKDFCSEKKIPAHRVAVVLPPELAFQRLLDLPATLTTSEAREYVLNPANGLQIPFPLTQTDFDLFPVSTPTEVQQVGGKRLYMLTAIPEVLVDSIVEMLQAADLELQLLELGSHSQLRNHAVDLITLAPQQVDLVLELLPDVSNLMLVSCSGLLGSERLAGLRNLPELDMDREQQDVALASGFSVEDLIFKDENYLPLSVLDLRVLVDDLKASFERFHLKLPGVQIRRLILTGVNSSHPLLVDLLAELLGLPVVLSQSIAAHGLADLSMDDLLLRSGLGRLSGLALGLLPNDQLLSCSLESHNLVDQDSSDSNNGVAIAGLLSESVAQTGLDLAAVGGSFSGSFTEVQSNPDTSSTIDTDLETPASLVRSVHSESDLLSEVVESPDLLIDSSASSTEFEVPPRSLREAEPLSDDQAVDEADSPEEQWPSIQAQASVNTDQGSAPIVTVALDGSLLKDNSRSYSSGAGMDVATPDMEWPSIADQDQTPSDLDQDLADAPSNWPSISTDEEENVNQTISNFEDPGDSLSSAEQLLDQPEFNQTPSSIPADKPHDTEKSSAEEFDFSMPLQDQDAMAEPREELVIPDLDSSEESDQAKKLSTDEVARGNDGATDEVQQDLGELRFADDD